MGTDSEHEVQISINFLFKIFKWTIPNVKDHRQNLVESYSKSSVDPK